MLAKALMSLTLHEPVVIPCVITYGHFSMKNACHVFKDLNIIFE